MKRANAGSCILEWTPSHSSAKRASAIEEPTLICGENHKCLKIAAKPRFEGSRRFKSPSLRQPVRTFCLHFGEGGNSARNVAFFLPAAHRREPAHAGFARFGEYCLRAKKKRFASAPECALGGVRPTIASPGDRKPNFNRSGLSVRERPRQIDAAEDRALLDTESVAFAAAIRAADRCG
jgi:hypothetical protein